MWIDLAFVFCGFIIDNVLRLMFPIDPAMRFLVFVPNLGFLAMLMVVLKKPLPQALGWALALGFVIDLIRQEPLSNVLAFPISVYMVKIWSQQINESLFEQVFAGTIGLFIKELAYYLILVILAETRLQIGPWFIKREFLTLIGHVPFLIGLSWLNRLKNGTQKNLDQRRRSRESIRWNPTVRP